MMCGIGIVALLVIGGVMGFVLSLWNDDGKYRRRTTRHQSPDNQQVNVRSKSMYLLPNGEAVTPSNHWHIIRSAI